jgi:parvulin-like peptidyl-prolyl isomerase
MSIGLQIAGGEDFGRVALLHSDCPENRGDLGWFASGVMVNQFDDLVFAAPLDELTPVFRAEFGFHFAIVHAKKTAGIRSFDEVISAIENSLWLARQDWEVGRALSTLQAKAVIRRTS